MKILIDRKTFAQALSEVAPFAPAKPTVMVLKYAKITTKDKRMKIEANDTQCSMVKYIETIECDQDDSFLVDIADLNKFIAKTKGDTIELTVDGGNVNVKHSKGSASFQAEDAKNFPSFELLKDGATEIRMPASFIADAVAKGKNFIMTDNLKPQMCAIYAYIKDGRFGYCATDTHKLIHNSVNIDSELDVHWSIMPAAFSSLVSNSKNGGDIVIHVTDKQASYRIGGCLIQTLMPAGNFPNFQRVIPQTWNMECAVDKGELLESLGRVSLFCDASECVKIDVSRMDMTLSVDNLNYMKSGKENLTHNGCDGEITIGVSANNAAVAAGVFDNGEVLIRMSDSARPMLFAQKDSENMQVVLMPMTIVND